MARVMVVLLHLAVGQALVALGVLIDKPIRRHEKDADSKLVEANAVHEGISKQELATERTEVDSFADLDQEMEELLDAPLADPRAERQRLAQRTRVMQERASLERQRLAAEQGRLAAEADKLRADRVQARADANAQRDGARNLQADRLGVDKRRAGESDRAFDERLREAKVAQRQQGKAQEMMLEEERLAKIEERKHQIQQEQKAREEAHEEIHEATRAFKAAQAQKRVAAELDVQNRRAARMEAAAKAKEEYEARHHAQAHQQAHKQEINHHARIARAVVLAGHHIYRQAILESGECRGQGRVRDHKNARQGHHLGANLGNVTWDALQELGTALTEHAKDRRLLDAVLAATTQTQNDVATFVVGLRDMVTYISTELADKPHDELVQGLTTFESDFAGLVSKHMTLPPRIVKNITSTMPVQTARKFISMIRLLVPPTLPVDFQSKAKAIMASQDECTRFTSTLRLLEPAYWRAHELHEQLNATSKLLHAVKASEDASNLAQNMLHLSYMEVIAIEEASADLISRLGPVYLTKLKCTYSYATSSRVGLFGFVVVFAMTVRAALV